MKNKQKSALMQKILVFNMNYQQVGIGYIFHYANGRMSNPSLFDNLGRELKSGEYGIIPTEELKLVVLTRTVQ